MKVIEDIIKKHKQVALLIGNGPNLAAGIMPSWKELLLSISDNALAIDTEGLSNTEVYDLVQLTLGNGIDAKQRVRKKLELTSSDCLDVHKRLMSLAIAHGCPVLTTNFDAAFEKSVGAKMYHVEAEGFTRYYPWKSYYGFAQHTLPTDGFGIWKVHGDVKYKDSIRLGLTDYMGSAQRARDIIHKGAGRLYNEYTTELWQGCKTWLHIWFNLPIVILGFGFGIDEVFLRWLLIERKRFANTTEKPMNVYYVTKGTPSPAIKNLMHNLGVTIKSVSSFDEIYC